MTMEISERHCSQALDDVVEALMDTGGWPAHGSAKLLLRDVLEEIDTADWFMDLVTLVHPDQHSEVLERVRGGVEAMLREKLENHYEVRFLAADYQRAACDEAMGDEAAWVL